MTPAEREIVARMTGREWMSAAEILGPDGGPERVRLREALLALVDRGLVATARRGWGTHAWWEYALSAWWWTAEPDVGRVAHGVPARVDRLRALGNAVVPAVAFEVGLILRELMG